MGFKEDFRLGILEASIPLVKFLGSISAPFAHKKVTGVHYYSILPYLKSGTVLITRTNGEVSNLMIPGHYSHTAIFVGAISIVVDGRPVIAPAVAEAVGHGTRVQDLLSFLTSKDEVLALSPTFATEHQMLAAAEWCLSNIGAPYDYVFEPTNKAFYCSEFVQAGYAAAIGTSVAFTKRTTLGVNTVVPQDYVNATDKWKLIWTSKQKHEGLLPLGTRTVP